MTRRSAEEAARAWLKERLYEATKTVSSAELSMGMTDPLPSLARLLEEYARGEREAARAEAALNGSDGRSSPKCSYDVVEVLRSLVKLVELNGYEPASINNPLDRAKELLDTLENTGL